MTGPLSRCRFCSDETDSDTSIDLFGSETLKKTVVTDNENTTVTSSITLVTATLQYLRLRLEQNSLFPTSICTWCRNGLQEIIVFIDKLQVGQLRLTYLLTDGRAIEEISPSKRGRPKKGFEKKIRNADVGIKQDSNVGKRKIKVPKKFENTLHDIKANDSEVPADQNNSKEEEYKLSIDEDLAGEGEYTVSIDLGNINTKVQENKDVIGELSRSVSCEICNDKFSGQDELNVHVSGDHGQIMYKCDLSSCSCLLRSKTELMDHQSGTGHKEFVILEIGAPLEFKCDQCQLEFVSRQKLNIHMAEIHGSTSSKLYTCSEPVCGRKFTAPSSLTYHRLSAHNKQCFPCTVEGCEKIFKIRNLLSRHLKTHNNEREYKCNLCEKSFKSQSNLHSHKAVHNTESQFFCDECGQQFKHRTSLVSHMRWHQGEKPFKCTYCQKSFNQNGNLQEHIRIHTGEKPFNCKLCPRAFTTSSQHKLHLKRHMGVKEFKCELCSKAFLNKDAYRTHLRRHKGEKPFACRFCKKAFAESWALTKHMRFHTGSQPYLCKECGKRFSDSSNLTKHRKTHETDGLVNKSKTVWNIVKNAAMIGLDDGQDDVQQVIYIAYDTNETQINLSPVDDNPVINSSEEPKEVEEENQTVDLTLKNGQQVRLVAPITVDPLTLATEYLKEQFTTN